MSSDQEQDDDGQTLWGDLRGVRVGVAVYTGPQSLRRVLDGRAAQSNGVESRASAVGIVFVTKKSNVRFGGTGASTPGTVLWVREKLLA